MLNGAVLSLTILGALSLSDLTLGRMLWAERDGRAVRLDPRRFDQQNPAFLTQLGSACPGQVCGVLAGQAVTPLLATQPECSQQDVADQIIGELRLLVKFVFSLTRRPDASKQFDSATQANMVALAKQYRQAEKNTPPVCFANGGSKN
jgi:hypothetical protein